MGVNLGRFGGDPERARYEPCWLFSSRFPEPFQERRIYSTSGATIPQLVSTNAQYSRHGFAKEFVPVLDEPVIAELAAGCFEPEP